MSAEQTPTPSRTSRPSGASGARNAAGPARPGRLTAAAVLVALEGLALLAGGLYILVRGLGGAPDDRRQAVTGGVTLMVLAVLPLLAAGGLLRRRAWSRGPAVITQILALPVAWNLLRAESLLIPGGIALAAVAVAGLVLLVHPATTKALGIRRPGSTADGSGGSS